MKIRIGTRRSDLALWQANFVARALRSAGAETEIVEMVTRGDRIDDVPLSSVEGKAFFTQEIEDALRDGRIDLAVHSHKDLPVEQPPGLEIVAVPERATVAERLLIAPGAHDPKASLLPLRRAARVGTSAPRRMEQLLALRPDLEILDLRGNVPTRVNRLREGRYDAIVLAAAGLDRLKLDTSDLVTVDLDTAHLVPAPAQGALAIQARSGDQARIALARSALHHETSERRVRAERSLLLELGGGCSLPLGASVAQVEVDGESLWRVQAFLGRDHPHPGAAARWVESLDRDLEAALESARERLRSGELTGCGPLGRCRVAFTGSGSGEQPSVLATKLTSLGAAVVHEQVIEFEDLPCAELQAKASRLAAGDGLAVTSREAARRLGGLRLAQGVRIAAVGAGTARALAAQGLVADTVGTRGARDLATGWELGKGARVLFPCAESARPDLDAALGARGIEVERLPLYRTVPRAGVVLDPDVEVRIYMSPSAVEAALPWEQGRVGAATRRIALGASTAELLQDSALEFAMPDNSTPDALLDLVAQSANTLRSRPASDPKATRTKA